MCEYSGIQTGLPCERYHPDPSVDVSDWEETYDLHMSAPVIKDIDQPIDITYSIAILLSRIGLSGLQIPFYRTPIVLPIRHNKRSENICY